MSQPPADLRQVQQQKWQSGLARVVRSNAFYRHKYQQAGLLDELLEQGLPLEQLHRLPLTTKDEVLADQLATPPYGTNLTEPLDQYVRLHQTSGTSGGTPMRWLDTAESWDWILNCWQEIYDAVGITLADRFFFPFSFGPFLGFWAAFEGAKRRGNFVLAGGGMATKVSLDVIQQHQISIVGCTPTYALRMADIADEIGFDLAHSPVRALVLAGEPGANIPATRRRLESAWGARVIDHSGMTEIGSLGIEFFDHPGKLALLETQCVPEFLDPQTGRPSASGELGELVITTLGRWASPLIRYRTGDLVRWYREDTPGGLPYVYLEGGILARADDMLWIKGNNVYPSALEAILREFEAVDEFQFEALTDANGATTLVVKVEWREPATATDEVLTQLSQAVQHRLNFRPRFERVASGSLPRFEMKARRLIRGSTD